jgi:anti-anti-sigma regulatory factor
MPFLSAAYVGARLAFHSAGNGMLRIHKKANGEVVFTLSGQLDQEHVPELEALIAAEGKDRRIILDLRDMTLTGEDGINFFAQCEAADIGLANCDPYVREWITRQKGGS